MMTQHRRTFLLINVKYLLAAAFILNAASVFSQDSPGSGSPENYINEILEKSETAEGQVRRDLLLDAAAIKSAAGEISEAAELFEKASFAVYGEKDFDALYKAAVLYIETADYKKAEALIRAISTFSSDSTLRIKASILNSRIMKLSDRIDESNEIIKDLLNSLEEYPPELIYWANEFYERFSDELDLSYIKKNLLNEADKKYIGSNRIITPEFMINSPDVTFSIKSTTENADAATNSSEETEAYQNKPAFIQLGSFKRKENADDMLKNVIARGFNAELKSKTVNGTEYIAVVVPVDDPDNIQNFYIKLKEAGFEGYPVY